MGVSRSDELDPVFLPYRWPNPNSGTPLASSDNFNFTSIDLNKDLPQLVALIERIRPSIAVNFAAQGMVAESWLNPTHWYQTNVVSQVAFHDSIRKFSFIEKYVHVTTPEVYGSTDDGWIPENINFSLVPYVVSRAACDLHLLSFMGI